MSARDALFNDIWDMRSAAEKNALIDAHRDEVALEIGRDALRDGLMPTLNRLAGEANAAKLMEEFRDAFTRDLLEQQRKVADEWATNGYTAEAHGLRQGAYVIESPKGPIGSPESTP